MPATQGGTGQTSFTTNCLIAASSSTALTCTGSPTISGANLTSGTIPNAALVSTPNLTTCGTWTPADASGQSITITIGSATYCHTSNTDGTFQTKVQADLNYGSSVSASAAKISGLPYASLAPHCSYAVGFANSSAIVPVAVLGESSNTTVDILSAVSGNALTDANMSTARLAFSGVCQTAL